MKYSELASRLNISTDTIDGTVENLSVHSDITLKNCAFLALLGDKSDGNLFIPQAIHAGCTGILTSKKINEKYSVPVLTVPDLEKKLWDIQKIIYPNYLKVNHIFGVTGTNGKTTISNVIKYLLEKFNNPCALIGTISCYDGKVLEVASHTTPPSTDICRILHNSFANQLNYCSMEVSSHSLKQSRLGNIKLRGGIFTNLTRDHLDYHKTMDDYKNSKLKMLESIHSDGVVIVNDNEFGNDIVKISKQKIFVVGKRKDSDYLIKDITMNLNGSQFKLFCNGSEYSITLPLIGEHNIYNCMQAIALLNQQGFSLPKMIEFIKYFTGVSGRLEFVKTKASKHPFVFVDYAHTPDAMDNVLKSVLNLKNTGKLWVVFGCGGDRDRTKRPLMAQSAEKYGDKVVVTSDNPRTEVAEEIIKEVCKGFSADYKYTAITDRREAIRYAIHNANENDMILLLGKGHEDYQIIGKTKYHFDDKEEAKNALQFWENKS